MNTEQNDECAFELTTIAQEISMQWDNGISGGAGRATIGGDDELVDVQRRLC